MQDSLNYLLHFYIYIFNKGKRCVDMCRYGGTDTKQVNDKTLLHIRIYWFIVLFRITKDRYIYLFIIV